MHAQWAAKCLPADAPQIQLQEMERAFYSGFFSALSHQLLVLANLPDDEAVEALDRLHKECETYFKTLGQAPRDIQRS
jgi:hypothetical protein